MNTEQSNPPALAIWVLQYLCPRTNREILIGDLLERFREGRSNRWFWRQVIVAVLVGASSRRRLFWTEICFAATGTGLIWCTPWGRVFPIAAMSNPSMNWMARFLWIAALEITTALLILPLFAVFFRFRRTLGWSTLRRAFVISAILFTAGDLPAIWWDVNHPISRSQAAWVVPMMIAWIFAALLISARAARWLPPARHSGA